MFRCAPTFLCKILINTDNTDKSNYYYCYYMTLHPFNGLFSRTTQVSRHQKGEPFWILLKQEMMGWQWYQLDHMQIICTSLETDSTSPVSTGRMSFLLPNQQRQRTERKIKISGTTTTTTATTTSI